MSRFTLDNSDVKKRPGFRSGTVVYPVRHVNNFQSSGLLPGTSPNFSDESFSRPGFKLGRPKNRKPNLNPVFDVNKAWSKLTISDLKNKQKRKEFFSKYMQEQLQLLQDGKIRNPRDQQNVISNMAILASVYNEDDEDADDGIFVKGMVNKFVIETNMPLDLKLYNFESKLIQGRYVTIESYLLFNSEDRTALDLYVIKRLNGQKLLVDPKMEHK